jgi:hypothetical protein
VDLLDRKKKAHWGTCGQLQAQTLQVQDKTSLVIVNLAISALSSSTFWLNLAG